MSEPVHTNGAPCWVDLQTSDTDRTRAFYTDLFGWKGQEAAPDFGGYFMFTVDDVPVAGCMPSTDQSPVADFWSVYLTTEDATKTIAAAKAAGGQVAVDAMAVADLGTMGMVIDPSGAAIGLWQPGSFPGLAPGFVTGKPAWYEVHSTDYPAAVAFYRDVFGWDTHTLSDTPEFRYTTLGDGAEASAGIMDAAGFLPDGVPSNWVIYFAVEDTDASLAKAVELGGSMVTPAEDTPHGRMATVTDVNGASFKIVAGGS